MWALGREGLEVQGIAGVGARGGVEVSAVRGGVVGKVGGDLWDEVRAEVSTEDDGLCQDVIVGLVIGAVHHKNVVHAKVQWGLKW